MLRGFIRLAAVAATCFLVTIGTAAATAGKRVALVIGNSDYKYSVALPNPRNDAALLAETLKLSGFEVISGTIWKSRR